MRTYRVALLGCGSRGRAHGRAYLTHPRTTLVALCDLDAGRLQALGTELGMERRYADLDAMLAAEAPDIVAIPTATEFHFPLAMRCLEQGCHIDVEKPICEHLDQADELLAAARRQNREIAVHHQWRVGPPSAAVLAALQEGRIGTLRYLYASGKGYYGGYGLPNIGTHLLNQLFAVAGRVRSVSGHVLTDGRAIGPHDVLQAPMGMGIVAGENITALLEFENGVCATLLQHRFEGIDLSAHVVEIYGTEGRLLWRPHGAFWLPTPNIPPGPNITTPPYDNAQWEALPLTPPAAWPDTGACSVDEFAFVDQYVAALDAGRSHPCSGAEGRHVMEVINALFFAAVQGRRIALKDMPRHHPLRAFRAECGLDPDPPPAPRAYRDWLAQEDARLGRAAPA